MSRRYSEIETERSVYIARVYELIHIAGSIIEELDCEDTEIFMDIQRESVFIRPLGCPRDIERQRIREVLGSIDTELWDRDRIIIESPQPSPRVFYRERMSLGDLFEEIYREVVRDIPQVVERSSIEGLLRQREYLLMLLDRGFWVVLEGEERRISIPRIEGVIASLHTHPSMSCIPSREDIESTIDLLSSGGILSGVIGGGCLFITRLKTYLSEEGYLLLMRFLNNYDEFLTKVAGHGQYGTLLDTRDLRIEILSSPLKPY